jgi:AraC-like DNA-binding protein/tetratricopeptide (TPR) repeat protein
MRIRQSCPAGTPQRTTERVVPRGVAKAVQFMRENLTARLDIAALSVASGLSERSLRRQFRAFTGQSPAVFHRSLRLEAAREALRADTSGTCVTAAAAEQGFSHFGHFAAQYRRRFGESPSDTLRATSETTARPGKHIVLERLGVAVQPFGTEECGPAELALAGALTDGVIFALGRMRWLDVIIPTPLTAGSFAPAFHAARYAVRGRVRRLGSRVQVTVRLFEIVTGRHVWGNAFEDDGDNTRVLLDIVIMEAVGALSIRLRDAEATRVEQMLLRDRTVHDLTMRSFRAASALTANFNARALEDLDRARALDPDAPLALALSAWCHAQRAIYNFAPSPEPERDTARRLAAWALSLDDEDPLTLAVLGNATTMIGDLDQAELLIGKCLAIDPYCAMAWQRRGWIAAYRGRYTALADFNHSLRLGSGDPERHNCLLGISTTHFGAGRYDEATEWAMRGVQERPSALWAYRVAAVAQARCGRHDEARHSTLLLRRHYPDLTVSAIVDAMPMQAEFLARFAEGMETAGLPV